MNKKFIASLLILSLLTGCSSTSAVSSGETNEPESSPVKLMVATDLHYLSPSLTDNGERFQAVMAAGDSKVTEYSEEIVDTLMKKAKEEKPDALPSMES